MKIKSMTATFGGLKNAKLTPGPGLTLIHAPNEGGKSTWAAFWRAMLYGIDTRDRDKKGYLADKNRYPPWSGARMEGELVLELAGRDLAAAGLGCHRPGVLNAAGHRGRPKLVVGEDEERFALLCRMDTDSLGRVRELEIGRDPDWEFDILETFKI